MSKINTKIKILTPRGARKIREEIKQYEERLAKTTKVKAEAVEVGGDRWHDNFSFEELERLQRLYGQRIIHLKDEIRTAKILSQKQIERNRQKNKVCIGSKIEIQHPNNKTSAFEIVGAGESDPSRGLAAYDTPLGQALLNKTPGQTLMLPNNTQAKLLRFIGSS